jgi:muramoyltetrapeptide carboxypeptidase
MIRPPFLQPGDAVGITAPASRVTPGELDTALDLIVAWGVRPVTARHLYSHNNSFAGNDAQRSADFQQMLDDPSIKAVICARGGYGTARILERLSIDSFLRHPKWIAGSSDITAIHAFLQQHGIESLHSVMPRSIKAGRPDLVSLDSLRRALFGQTTEIRAPAHSYNRTGTAQGILTGGNLSVLCSLAGTKYDIDTHGHILFIEDLHEYLYHVDRMLMNLRLAGKLDNLHGLIVGSMQGMKISVSGYRKPAYDIIREAAEPYGYPVAFGFPAGHGSPNLTLILGREVTLEVNEQSCKLIF